MTKYITMNAQTMAVVSDGDTREEARENLKKLATPGVTYLEAKILGEPLEIRTRKVTTLGTVKKTDGKLKEAE